MGLIPDLRLTYLVQFNERKSALHRRLCIAIMNPVSRMADFECNEVTKANGKYLFHLKRCGILPYKDSFDEQSFSTIVKKASQVESRQVQMCRSVQCGCNKLGNMDPKVELQKGLAKCEKLELGLCIHCIKTKEKPSEEGSGKCIH